MEEILKLLNETRRPFVRLAQEAGLSRNTLYNIRQSPRSAKIGTLEALARVLGYKVEIRLVKIDDTKP